MELTGVLVYDVKVFGEVLICYDHSASAIENVKNHTAFSNAELRAIRTKISLQTKAFLEACLDSDAKRDVIDRAQS